MFTYGLAGNYFIDSESFTTMITTSLNVIHRHVDISSVTLLNVFDKILKYCFRNLYKDGITKYSYTGTF